MKIPPDSDAWLGMRMAAIEQLESGHSPLIASSCSQLLLTGVVVEKGLVVDETANCTAERLVVFVPAV